VKTATLLIEPTGEVLCLYTEAIPLRSLGRITTRRASTVEFNDTVQEWQVGEPGRDTVHYSHPSREACLEWERRTFSRSRSLRQLNKRKPTT